MQDDLITVPKATVTVNKTGIRSVIGSVIFFFKQKIISILCKRNKCFLESLLIDEEGLLFHAEYAGVGEILFQYEWYDIEISNHVLTSLGKGLELKYSKTRDANFFYDAVLCFVTIKDLHGLRGLSITASIYGDEDMVNECDRQVSLIKNGS